MAILGLLEGAHYLPDCTNRNEGRDARNSCCHVWKQNPRGVCVRRAHGPEVGLCWDRESETCWCKNKLCGQELALREATRSRGGTRLKIHRSGGGLRRSRPGRFMSRLRPRSRDVTTGRLDGWREWRRQVELGPAAQRACRLVASSTSASTTPALSTRCRSCSAGNEPESGHHAFVSTRCTHALVHEPHLNAAGSGAVAQAQRPTCSCHRNVTGSAVLYCLSHVRSRSPAVNKPGRSRLS